MSTILDDDDLNHLNINLNELNTLEGDGNNNSTLIHKKGGKKKDKVWEYFNIVDIPNDAHKGAVCKFCSASWKHGKPNEMKSHLALRCSKVTYNVKMEYLNAISSNEDSSSTQLNTNYKKNDNTIPDFTKAHKALTRFFVCCGIPFSVVNSPFFHDFVKSLCFEYELQKRTILSTTYLDAETASITLKIEELHQAKNLTLGKKLSLILLLY
jgi:hypothetical protein